MDIDSAIDNFAMKGDDRREERRSEGVGAGEEIWCAGASVGEDAEASRVAKVFLPFGVADSMREGERFCLGVTGFV